MRSIIHFVAFVLLSSFHGSILGTRDEVTGELHEEGSLSWQRTSRF